MLKMCHFSMILIKKCIKYKGMLLFQTKINLCSKKIVFFKIKHNDNLF